ncbi:hypothetical protein ANN_02078 [Periplaneta americana]|uniref:Reverse transcriptase domain-containing protein n=1 Tax=Periplaneta americana TaxID=6978 RepID=A0ABQ8TYR1_PERAM|nr:hypothetical protein ANN_02078 [Periplaneta americana]
MSPGSSTESYPAFARIGLRENPGKNLNQVTCPDRDSNSGHLISRPDALTVTPQKGGDVIAGDYVRPVKLERFKTSPAAREHIDKQKRVTRNKTSKWADNRQATNFECTLTPCDLNCGFLLTNSDVYYANQDFRDNAIRPSLPLYQGITTYYNIKNTITIAFDKVNRNKLLQILADDQVPQQIIQNIYNIYKTTIIAIRSNNKLSQWRPIYSGVRQGCGLSPLLFIIYINRIIQDWRQTRHGFIPINGNLQLDALLFADDLVLMASTEDDLQYSVHNLNKVSEKYNMEINIEKSKIMSFCGKFLYQAKSV